MKYGYNLAGVGEAVLKTFLIGGTVGAGVPVQKDTGKLGDVIAVTATGDNDAMGLSLSSGTYAASTGVTVDCVVNPYAVLVGRCSGSTTSGTLLSAATKHVLTQTSASQIVITATDAPADDITGGSAFGLTGANVGVRRVVYSRSSTASVTCTNGFNNSVAVGDKVLCLPMSIGSRDLRLTADFKEFDAAEVIGATDISCAVVDMWLQSPINSTNPEVLVGIVLVDTAWAPLS